MSLSTLFKSYQDNEFVIQEKYIFHAVFHDSFLLRKSCHPAPSCLLTMSLVNISLKL